MTMVAATVNQEATAPTGNSAEYALWLSYINRAVDEWSESFDWEVLRKTFYPSVTGVSQASVQMPDDFRKLAGPVKLNLLNEARPKEIPHELPERVGLHNSTDEFLTVVGDTSSGHNLRFFPGTLASGASIVVEYFSTPTSLASSAQLTPVPDPQFLIDRTIAYIFESRSDPRFQLVENKARERLLTMIENANAAKYDSYSNQNYLLTPERKSNFRIGRN